MGGVTVVVRGRGGSRRGAEIAEFFFDDGFGWADWRSYGVEFIRRRECAEFIGF
jgi:hypothetical protein